MRLRSLLVTGAMALAACSAPAPPDEALQTASSSPSASEASPSATPGPAGRPRWLVAVTDDHRLVVVDPETAEIVRVLHQGDDPDDFGDEGEEPFAAGAFLESVAVDQAGGLVWFPTCCEPAPGALRTVPVTGGEPRTVGVGYDPVLHPTADRVAVVEMQWISILDFTGRATHRFEPAEQPPMEISRPSWSPDGRTLVYQAVTDNRGEPEIHLLPANARSMSDARVLPVREDRPAPWRSPVFDAAGGLWVLEHAPPPGASPDEAGAARLRVDPATGAVLERQALPTAVTGQGYDRSGTHLVLVLAGGDLYWEGAGQSRRVPGSYISAAW